MTGTSAYIFTHLVKTAVITDLLS